MKKGPRRILFWLLFAAYAAVSGWWLVSVPHRPDQLLRAIPGQADLVSFHEGLAGRWATASRHPAVMMLVGALGGDAKAWEALDEDPGFRVLLDLAGRNELVLARVPFLGDQPGGAWVAASWIGGQSQRLRWSHRFMNLPGLTTVGSIANWPVWIWQWNSGTGLQQLTLALVDGILIGTNAREISAMHHLLDTYNGNVPSQATRSDMASWNRELLASAYPDRFLFKQSRGWMDPLLWLGAYDVSGTNAIAGVVKSSLSVNNPGLSSSLELDGLRGLWGGRPIATLAVGMEQVAWALTLQQNIATRLVSDVVLNSGAESAALALFGGDYGGRFRVIRVPTLMAALQRAEGVDPADLLPRLTDRWNARFQLGVIPVQESVNGQAVWRLEGIAGGAYGLLGPSDQVAVTTAGNWLVVSSNFAALEKMIREGTGGSHAPGWADHMNDLAGRGGMGYVGFDLPRCAEAFRLAIMAYSYKLAFDDAAGTRAQRQQLNEAQAWLDTIGKMGRLDVVATAPEDRVQIEFKTVTEK